MTLPPGLRFLLQALPRVVLPPIAAYIVQCICEAKLGRVFPIWLVILVYSSSWLLAMVATAQWSSMRKRLEANTHNAVLVPFVDHRWPGNLDFMISMIRYDGTKIIAHAMFELREKYGNTFNSGVLLSDRVFTCEPEYIKLILATDFPGYEKGPYFHAQMQSLLGTGVFNSDGDMWKFHRSITRPFFSKDRISHFQIFDHHAEDALTQMKQRMRQGYAVDWQDLVSRFTLDSATEFLFGRDVQSLSAGLPYPPNSAAAQDVLKGSIHPADVFAGAFLSAQQTIVKRSRYLGAWPLFEFWKDRVQGFMQVIDQFMDPLVRDALLNKRKEPQTSDPKISDDETLLGYLVQMTEDVQILKDETLNILLAGRDTTACTLTFAIYALSEHPEIMKRLREEILATVGPLRPPTYDDIRDMKYLRAFINEVLRLYPPVPINVRTSVRSAIWPSKDPGSKPFYIPAGTRCQYSVFVMHRRKDLWGPDALEFDPDRFLDDRVSKYSTPNPFIFLPFNAGPRICLGQQFAYNEVSFMLVRLLQQFAAIERVPEASPKSALPDGYADSPGSNGSDKIRMKSHLTLYAEGGLWVKMTEASPVETA